MGEIKEASSVPGMTTYEEFDVLSGKNPISKAEYKASTFHTSSMTDGDASFRKKAELMEGSGSEIIGDSKETETSGDASAAAKTKAEAVQAAV